MNFKSRPPKSKWNAAPGHRNLWVTWMRDGIRRRMTQSGSRTAWLTLVALALSGCLLGPWNLTPQDQQAKVQIEVACMLVSGKPFDTLWLERPLDFNSAYDSTAAFIDTNASTVRIIRTDVTPRETTMYSMSLPYTRAWLPRAPGAVARAGGKYRLEAFIRWDAARTYPQTHAFQVDTLSAEAYIQARYHIRDTAYAPLEAMHPSLSQGLSANTASAALASDAGLSALYDSLDAIYPLRNHGITQEDLSQYLKGYPVQKPLHRGDTAFYIFDASKVKDANPGNPDLISRYSRQWNFLQDLDKRQFGGLVASYMHDTLGNRILDPLNQALQAARGRTSIDSAQQYQQGQTRFLGLTGSVVAGNTAYPDTVAWGNRNLSYTGPDMIYFYGVDSLYAIYQRSLNSGFTVSLGGGGGGGGIGRGAGNVVHFTNIEGGDGYFSAAAVDSFPVFLRAMQDTLPLPALHQAWLVRDAKRRRGGGGGGGLGF